MKTIEICTNDEWYYACGPLDAGLEEDTTEATEHYQKRVIDLLEMNDLFEGFEIVCAHGQRALCHGWNGASWFDGYCIGGIGTFDGLSPVQINQIDQAHYIALSEAQALVDATA